MKPDALDLGLLRELDSDAGQSLEYTGARLGVGRDVAHYRMKRLESLGIIAGYGLLIDHSKLGVLLARGSAKFGAGNPAGDEKSSARLRAHRAMLHLGGRTGAYDVDFAWRGNDAATLREAQDSLLPSFGAVREFRAELICRIHIWQRMFQFPVQGVPFRGAKRKTFTLELRQENKADETDARMLALLAGNARASHARVAESLDISPAQAHRRMRRLEAEKAVLGTRALFNVHALGLRRFRMRVFLDAQPARAKLLAWAAAHPSSVGAIETVGGADVELAFECAGYDEFRAVDSDMKKRFGPAIRYTEDYESTDAIAPVLPF